MKILHITTHFSPFIGGLENLVFDLAREQAKRHDVSVLTLKYDESLPDFEIKHGIKIYRYPAFTILKHRYLWPKFGFSQQIAKIDPNVIITHTRFFATSYFGQKLKGSWKKIHVEHGHNFVRSKNLIIKVGAWMFDVLFGKKVFHNTAQIVVLSELGKSFVEKFLINRKIKSFPQKIHIIENGVMIPDFLQQPPQKNNALFFGRMIKEKGLDEVIYAAKQNPAWQFSLYGIGNLPSDLPKNVFYGGAVLPEKIPSIIQSADLVILPSWSEGASLAVLESAANGRPILATPVGQNEKIISSDFLVPVRDKQALSDKIKFLTDKFDLLQEEGKKIQNVVEEKYSFSKMVQEYEKVLRSK